MTARDRTIAAQAARLRSVERAEVFRRAIQQPTLYDGQGRVKALGAAGSVPVRGLNATGSLSVGEPLPVSQGMAQGLPDATPRQAFEDGQKQLLEQLAEVRNRRGIQLFLGDPNDENAPALQDFNYQLLWREDTSHLYYWGPSDDGVTPGSWVSLLGAAEETNGYIEAPAQGAVYPLVSRATYASIVNSLSITVDGAAVTTDVVSDTNVTVGSTTVEISVAIGDALSEGDSLTLTPTASDGTAIAFTVGYLR
ncbi:MAG: hypothetical protein AAFV85_23115 [Cyanobacteria bacterium J06634_6]